VRATGGFSFVNPARNTSKITPVAHPRVDPYDLHHLTGHERRAFRRIHSGQISGR
jgi:hypothetical protein